jgi:hypothetical protein
MAAIRIRKTIDSETLTLPELRPLIDRTVDILIEEPAPQEVLPPGFRPGTGDWDAVLAATRQLQDYDYQAQVDQDACDIRDAEDRLR